MKASYLIRFVGIAVVFSGLTFVGAFDGKAESEAFYKAVAAKANEGLPKQIDESTRWDKLDVGAGVYTYHMTIIGKMDSTRREKLSKNLGPNLTRLVCNGEYNLKLLNKGRTIIYAYTDEEGKLIGKFTYKKSDCARPKAS